MKTFGEQLRYRRQQLGFTQEQIARKLDVTVRQYCRWETGETKISVYYLAKWIELSGTAYEDIHESLLLYGESEKLQ
ncbi:helix-turn-helix domain-containing protein [Herpetosiphon geysericola]|uniref:HTH cro/C1-type domain-containing protein n=1 Tax=Herpetosiphon geysericola TaxID=70996 RepID=A0A0P6XBT9_9CHLR|nr:helix-turn-helix transcriptional regulator [Herpetosiphon geysericola]KPL80219.1 hypothetical protein SE18_24495 [Herpetosiphon geysericola]